jgi:hypothetical protein
MKRSDYTDIPPSYLELKAMLASGDELRVILKGHLFVEHYLALLLCTTHGVTEAKAFDLRFAEKIDRAVQAGVIPAEEDALFKAINTVRNRFAHEPRSYFSEEAAGEIWAKATPRVIDRFVKIDRPGADYFDIPLDFWKSVIAVLCALLEDELAARGNAATPGSA